MDKAGLSFRWWYLLFLVPPLLYVGARWYAGHRIEKLIDDANRDGNRLSVGDYSFGLLPLGLTARDIEFDQDRDGIRAEGHLNLLSVQRIGLTALISGKVEVDSLYVRGLDATLLSTTDSTRSSSSTPEVSVATVRFDSTYIDATQRSTERRAILTGVSLSLGGFRLPFQPSALRQLQLRADSVEYRDPPKALSVTLADVQHQQTIDATLVSTIDIQQDTTTDLKVDRLSLIGLNTDDLDSTLTLDRIELARLGGSAQVPVRQRKKNPFTNLPTAKIGRIDLPKIDLMLTGQFGKVDYRGNLHLTEIAMTDTLNCERIDFVAESLDVLTPKGTRVAATDVVLQQDRIGFPLSLPGKTKARIDSVTVSTADSRYAASDIVYDSPSSVLAIADVDLEMKSARLRSDSVRVNGVRRDLLINEGRMAAENAVVQRLQVVIEQKDGGRYDLHVPKVSIDDIDQGDGFTAERLRIADATVSRTGSNGERDLLAERIYLDQYRVNTRKQPGQWGEVNLGVDSMTLSSSTVPLDYRLDRITYKSRADAINIRAIKRDNRLSPDSLFAQRIAKSWLGFALDSIQLTGIDRPSLLSGKRVTVDSLGVDRLTLDVIEDIALDLPKESKPLPIEALRQLGVRIVLDRMIIHQANISYGVVDTVLDPKTIHFTDSRIQLSDLDTEVSKTDTVDVSIRTTFEASTPMQASFGLARDTSGRNFAFAGSLGRYDLSSVNPLMRVAADAVVQSGIIDSVSYRGRLDGEVAEGSMNLLYHNLAVEVVGSGGWWKNMLSGLVLKDSNQAGEDFRPGRMYHEHMRSKSFFNAYWKSLLSGMKSSAMADIALKEELD